MGKNNTILILGAGVIAVLFLLPRNEGYDSGFPGLGGLGGGGIITIPGGNGGQSIFERITETITGAVKDGGVEVITNIIPDVLKDPGTAITDALGNFSIEAWLDKFIPKGETETDSPGDPPPGKNDTDLAQAYLGLQPSEKGLLERWGDFVSGWQNIIPEFHLWDRPGHATLSPYALSLQDKEKEAVTVPESIDLSGEVWGRASTADRIKWSFTGRGIPGTISFPQEAVSRDRLDAQATNDPGLARAYKRADKLREKYGVS